jgi:hypothetical protein
MNYIKITLRAIIGILLTLIAFDVIGQTTVGKFPNSVGIQSNHEGWRVWDIYIIEGGDTIPTRHPECTGPTDVAIGQNCSWDYRPDIDCGKTYYFTNRKYHVVRNNEGVLVAEDTPVLESFVYRCASCD